MRVSGTLAEIFTQHGHNCYLCYYLDNTGEPCPFFADRLVLEPHNEEESLTRFVQSGNIDIIILQVPLNNTNWYLLPLLRKIADANRCTLVHCIHTIPFAECKGYDWSYIRYMMSQKQPLSQKAKNVFWGLCCILFPRMATRRTAARYERICNYCDKTVLLSDKYVPFFIKNVKCNPQGVMGLYNPLTYPFRLTSRDLDNKEKKVVIVGRLDESTKRLSKAIRIWSLIEKDFKADDWSLLFVGDGAEWDYYRKMVEKKGLRNISFVGRTDPADYYRKASIVMSTSAIEGLPMVILEAKQMGCVPIAFDSFDAVYDLIEDSKTGYIVRYNDYKGYASRLHYLMTHHDVLKEMMENCLQSNDAFLPDAIYEAWKSIVCQSNGKE